MNYTLRDYNGQELTLTNDQATKIAAAAELLEVTVNGQTHYLNPKNIASIKPAQATAADDLSYRRERLIGRGKSERLQAGF